jgi:hypothetical protein
MKNIFKIAALAVLFITGVSCENDDQMIVSKVGGPELLTPVNGSSYVLLPANASSEATTLVWNHANYSIQTEVNYTIEVAVAGTEFATIISGGTTTNRFATWSVEAFNAVALQAGLTPFSVGQLDIRVKSALGTNAELVDYSNVVTISVTPYSTALPKLWMPGSYQIDSGYGTSNWSHAAAATVASSGYGRTDFEGYVYFASNQAAPNDGFKFTDAPDWNHGVFGDDGSFSGSLPTTGQGNNIGVTAGFYRVKANTATTGSGARTYSVVPYTWRIIGDAVGGWSDSNEVTLVYNTSTKKLTAIATLAAGSFKFRANASWADENNFGVFDPVKELAGTTMSYNGGNFNLATGGTYKIELDLSNPRAYSYTMTLQ